MFVHAYVCLLPVSQVAGPVWGFVFLISFLACLALGAGQQQQQEQLQLHNGIANCFQLLASASGHSWLADGWPDGWTDGATERRTQKTAWLTLTDVALTSNINCKVKGKRKRSQGNYIAGRQRTEEEAQQQSFRYPNLSCVVVCAWPRDTL